jgi:acetylornithine deacetylase
MSAFLDDVSLLERLVAFDTTSGRSNIPCADFIEDYVAAPGVRVERNASPDGTRVNLVIRAGPPAASERRGLVLSGHMDVVPADAKQWHGDPYTLLRVDDRLVGRGACDMKGFLALAMNVFRETPADALGHPLVLLFTYDEEVGTVGSRHFVETFPTPDSLPRAVLIGEPTGLQPLRMHKGHLKLRVTLRGQSAHSGLPHLGRNAIEPAGPLLNALVELRTAWLQERPPASEYFPDTPYAALNVARISGGSAINVIPHRCTIDLGVRTLPGMDTGAIVEQIRNAAETALGDIPWTLDVLGDSPPMITREDAALWRILSEAIPDALSDHGAAFATDGGWLSRLDMTCALWGPGAMEVAHKPNEYMTTGALDRGRTVLRNIVQRMCGSEAPA